MIVEVQFGSSSRQLNYFKPRAMLGRDAEGADMTVPDPSVSRRHAELWLDGEVVYLRDLGSANGTWLDGQPLGPAAVVVQPGQAIHVGHTPLVVKWPAQGPDAETSSAPPSAQLMAAIAQRAQAQAAPPSQPQYAYAPPQNFAPQQQVAAQYQQQPPQHQAQQGYQPPQPQPPAQAQQQHAPAQAGVGVGGSAAPLPTELSYRRQGGNSNGTLLIALAGDTFANESTLDGFLEFTATDAETVASVIIELLEFHKKGPNKGHVWDRCLVRQGPWKTKKGDVLPMPFRLRVPSGTSASSPHCHWMLRAYVDIKWAKDIEATAPINMRNIDIERIRDALGMLDYRIATLDAEPLGQKYRGTFNPPMHLTRELNITDINLDIEYVGTNLKVTMEVEKSKLFQRDKREDFVFALDRLRTASVQELAQHWQAEINKLMG